MRLQVNGSGRGAAQFVAGQVVTPELVQAQWSSAASASSGRSELSHHSAAEICGIVMAGPVRL
jgi:hypothetical protein